MRLPAAPNRATVLTLGMLAITTGVGAQQPDSARVVLQRAQRANWYVRALRADSSTIEGRVPFVRDTSATIGRQRIAFTRITAIDRRVQSGSLAPNGAIAGTLLFGALGLTLAGLCEYDCGRVLLISTAGGAAIGAAMGAATGGLANAGTPTWERLWGTATIARQTEVSPDTSVSRSPRGALTTYAGGLVWRRTQGYPPVLPSLFGVQLASQTGNLEITFLDLFLTWVEPINGFSLAAGANWQGFTNYYFGAAGGVARLGEGSGGIVLARAGVQPRVGSGFRLELRAVGSLYGDPLTIGYIVLGYDVRRLH